MNWRQQHECLRYHKVMTANVSNTSSDLLIGAWNGLLSEAYSLDKLLNRNHSQHRVGKYYRSLERVRRALKSELGIHYDYVTVPAVYHLVEDRCEKLVRAPAGRAERHRRMWCEEARVVANHLMEATQGCDSVMGACLFAAAHLRYWRFVSVRRFIWISTSLTCTSFPVCFAHSLLTMRLQRTAACYGALYAIWYYTVGLYCQDFSLFARASRSSLSGVSTSADDSCLSAQSKTASVDKLLPPG